MTIRFSHVNLADEADLDPSSQVDSLPAANLLDPRPTRVWRTTAAAAESVVLDLGQSRSATLAALLEHNLTSAATVSLQANDSDSWDSPPFQLQLDWHDRILISFFSGAAYRFWRLTLTDSSNPDGYIQLGRFWLATFFQPGRDFSKDFSITTVNPSPILYSDSGSKSAGERTPYRSASLLFPNTDEKPQFEQIFAALPGRRDFLVSLDPQNDVWSDGLHDYTLYCHLERDPEWLHKLGSRWALRLNLRETI